MLQGAHPPIDPKDIKSLLEEPDSPRIGSLELEEPLFCVSTLARIEDACFTKSALFESDPCGVVLQAGSTPGLTDLKF
ncbi:158_t:CDS:2 [Funneliformis caledonium]|uniref:158_t:CDS:1 n=1 Tax=Funneliformis caledonium TaxID=1117310 RepID=A0A9N8WKG6_9GLOM|nr:158_t:CDS:2 [Funneliformis caledonium]